MILKDYQTKDPSYFEGDRPEMLRFLPKNAKRILDVGCSSGRFGKLIKERSGAQVFGIDLNPQVLSAAQKNLDQVVIGRVEETLEKMEEGSFDVIFFNDVLEHLMNPDQVLEIARRKLSPEGIVVASIPNLRYFRSLGSLVFARDFRYEASGVMDQTHLRFFTQKSIVRLFEEALFEIVRMEGINPTESLRPYLYHVVSFGLWGLDTRFPQFAIVAKPRFSAL